MLALRCVEMLIIIIIYYDSFIHLYMLSKMSAAVCIGWFLFIYSFRLSYFVAIFSLRWCSMSQCPERWKRFLAQFLQTIFVGFHFFTRQLRRMCLRYLSCLWLLLLRIVYILNPFNGMNGPGNLPTCARFCTLQNDIMIISIEFQWIGMKM